MKKIFSLLLVIAVLLMTFSMTFAENSITKDFYQAEKMNSRFKTELEKNSSLSSHAKKSIIKKNKEIELMILNDLNTQTKKIEMAESMLLRTSDYTGIPSSIPTISTGLKIYSTANEAKSYYDDDATAEYNISGTPKNTISVDAGFTDLDGTAYAWTGKRFKYTGSTSKSGKIKAVDIDIYGSMFVTFVGSSTQFYNDLRLFDATTGEWVDTKYLTYDTLVQKGSTNQKDVVGTYSDYFTATLEPNHTYVVLLMTYGYGYAPTGTAKINIIPEGAEWGELWVDLR